MSTDVDEAGAPLPIDFAHPFLVGEWVRFPAQTERWMVSAHCADGAYLLARFDHQGRCSHSLHTDPHPTLYAAR